MALPERTFGLPFGGPSVYLDTSQSEVVDATAGEPSLFIPGEDFVLGASYERLGPDLLLSGEEYSVFVKGYFTHEQAPDLYTTDGSAVVRGSVATRLAGPATPGQFAQADAVPGTAPIGFVGNVEGRVFLSRLDGTNVLAESGTPVFLGDIVESEGGSNIGITFVDSSTFALGESGRMIIDELVYDPVDGTGESAFNVLKGVFSFVSGDIAETGDDAMMVNTPVLSIGVRGTTVAGRAAAEGSANTVTLLPDASGTVGSIAVSNEAGVQVMSQPFATTTVTSLFEAPPIPTALPASAVQDLYGDISTVLPPEPASRQQDSSDDESEGEQQEEAEAEREQDEELEEGEEAPEGEAGPEGEEVEEGLEEGEQPEEGEGLEAEGESQNEGERRERQRDGEEGPEEEGEPGEGRQERSDLDRVDDGEERQQRRIETAREAREKAIEEGASEDEAYNIAAENIGRSEEESDVAREAYQEARREGLSREEALYRAEGEVSRSNIEGSLREGSTIEGAIRSAVGTEGTYREVGAAASATWRSINEAYQGKDTSGLSTLVSATATSSSDDVFADTLRAGGSVNDAWQAAHRANFESQTNATGVVGTDAYGRPLLFDYAANALWAKGFNPTLKIVAEVEEVLREISLEIARSGGQGAVTTFSEIIEATTGDDIITGSNRDTQIRLIQGRSLGGNDVLIGGGGTNELSFENLNDILFFVGGGNFRPEAQYSSRDGSITGSFTSTNILQILFDDGAEASQRFLFSESDPLGTYLALAGSSAADTISLAGDGTSAADITFGSGSSAVAVDVDPSDFLGAIVYGGSGDDTIVLGSRGTYLVDGGAGNDIITGGPGGDALIGGSGDDTFIVANPNDLKDALIAGGANDTNTGDTLQIGNSTTSTGQTFQLDDKATSGLETLSVFTDNTTIVVGSTQLRNFDSVVGVDKNNNGIDDDVTGVTLQGAFQTVNLAGLTVSTAVSTLSATPDGSNGVSITDTGDDTNRIILGSAFNDGLSGQGGDDIFVPLGGFDFVSGGDGNDAILVLANSDLTSGFSFSGGAGTDTLLVFNSAVTELELSLTNSSLVSVEAWNTTSGDADGVTIKTNNNVLFFSGIETITAGDGSGDNLKIGQLNGQAGFVDLRGKTLSKVDTITLTEASFAQDLIIDSDTTLTGLGAITGTVSSTGIADEEVFVLGGDFDFSGVAFSNIQQVFIRNADFSSSQDSKQTIGLDSTTDFANGSGATGRITGFDSTGLKNAISSITASDVFDYKSDLKSGNGTTLSSSNNLTINDISTIPSGGRVDYISGDTSGIVEFEGGTRRLDLNFTTSTAGEIESAIEALLESTDSNSNLTGLSAQVTQGAANTDCLLLFVDTANSNTAIVRYQEGGTSEADFSGELNLLAVVDAGFNFADGDII